MIIDRTSLAGSHSYFRRPDGNFNLAASSPATIRTAPLKKGEQLEISGLQLLIEGADLSPLFQFRAEPLFRLTLMKEMFVGFFADPYRHRVHNIAGSIDFSEGTLNNGRVTEVESIPTICSIGREECSWVSKRYLLPYPANFDFAAWELATSRLTHADSFRYEIKVDCYGGSGGLQSISTEGDVSAEKPRFRAQRVDGVTSFDVRFRANVRQDSFVTERQLPSMNEKVGRPLLRAVNVLELLENSIYDIHSLTELRTLCSDFHLSETPGPNITRLVATWDFSAILVNSVHQKIVNQDIYDANTAYEYIEVNLITDLFSTFEAKLIGTITRRSI